MALGPLGSSISGISLPAVTSPTIAQVKKSGVGLDLSGIKEAVSLQYQSVKGNNPTVNFRQLSISDIISVQDASVKLERGSRLDSISRKTLYGDRFLSVQSGKFTQIAGSLADLKHQSDAIASGATLNNKSLSTSDPSVLSASVTSDAVKGKQTVEVKSLAKSHEVASSHLTNSDASLGLTGSVTIGGVNIDIVATDSLASIAEKINYGEDKNLNGVLDGNEDINGNNRLDTINIKGGSTGNGYFPTFYKKEDTNNNGKVDTTEDTNKNKKLDFTSTQTGIRALVIGDQLIIASDKPGNIDISFKDPNGILQSLGFLLRDNKTGKVAINSSNDNTQLAQNASIILNGKLYSLPENFSSNLIAGITIQLKSAGKETLTVTEDPKNVVAPVAKLSSSYNSAIRQLNSTISGNGAISNNVRLQSIYTGTLKALLSSPTINLGVFASLNDIGIITNENLPTATDQSVFENLPSLAKDNLALPGKGTFSLISKSEKVGVNSKDNFTVKVDRGKLKKAVSADFNSLRTLLSYSASRLSGQLDGVLNKDYGTIKFQQDVINSYGDNPLLTRNLIAQSAKVAGTKIATESNRVVFSTIG